MTMLKTYENNSALQIYKKIIIQINGNNFFNILLPSVAILENNINI